MQEVILSVKTVYFTSQMQAQLARIAGENVARSELILNYARERYSAGIARKSDVLKAESDLAEAEYERNVYLNSHKKSITDLAMITGLPAGFKLSTDSSWLTVPAGSGSLISDSLIQSAYMQYPELRVMLNLQSSQQFRINETKADLYPSLNLNAGYEWSYNPVIQDQKSWYSMLTLRWDIFSGNEKRYRIKSETIRSEIYKNREEEIRNYLVKEVSNRLVSITEALEQVRLTGSLMKTTAENLEIARAQYSAGTGSMLELTDARITDLSAHKNNIQAITSFRIAMASLERLTGKTNENESSY
jgi:OMF family outer membrane factor